MCSSDLRPAGRPAGRLCFGPIVAVKTSPRALLVLSLFFGLAVVLLVLTAACLQLERQRTIGRASCRETVYISVVAVSLKTQTPRLAARQLVPASPSSTPPSPPRCLRVLASVIVISCVSVLLVSWWENLRHGKPESAQIQQKPYKFFKRPVIAKLNTYI